MAEPFTIATFAHASIVSFLFALAIMLGVVAGEMHCRLARRSRREKELTDPCPFTAGRSGAYRRPTTDTSRFIP